LGHRGKDYFFLEGGGRVNNSIKTNKQYKNTSTAITGATRPEQLEDTVGAVQVIYF
jgi:hypothetical protein